MDPIIFEMPWRVTFANGESMLIEDEADAVVLASARGGVAKRLATQVPGLENFGLSKHVSKPIETVHRGVVRLLWRVANKSSLVCRNPEVLAKSGLLRPEELGFEAPKEEVPPPPAEKELSEPMPNFYGMTKSDLRDYADSHDIHVKMSMKRDEMAQILIDAIGKRRAGLADSEAVAVSDESESTASD